MAAYTREDYELMCDRRRHAFQEIARKLGKEHRITLLMGPLAWGRNEYEHSPGRTAANAHEEFGYLEGCFHILNIWARDNDQQAQRSMLKLWPHGYESARSKES